MSICPLYHQAMSEGEMLFYKVDSKMDYFCHTIMKRKQEQNKREREKFGMDAMTHTHFDSCTAMYS